MSQCSGFEITDRKLDDRVVAMLGLNDSDLFGPVGDERVMAPTRQKLRLIRGFTHPTNDQPTAGIDGLGDLGQIGLRVTLKSGPSLIGNLFDCRCDRLGLPRVGLTPDR